MKILFITQLTENTTIPINNTISDSLLLGLKDIYPTDVVDYPGAWYMDKNEVKKRNYAYKKNFWGNGFTYYDIISDYHQVDRNDILNKVNNNYFNFIIYGAIRWSKKFLNEAISSTSKLIFIDGDDNKLKNTNFLKHGIYFKRELIEHDYKNVFPINITIPKQKIIEKINEMPTNLLAPLIPYRRNTYIYDNEKDYYKMWQNSIFGITYVRDGSWDAIRFHEMLMNGCIPLILNLEECPTNTSTKLPKKKLIDIFNKYSWILNQNYPPKIYKKKFLSTKKFILYFQTLFHKKYNAESFILDFPEINEIREELLEYTKNNITTETMATDVIKISKNFFHH